MNIFNTRSLAIWTLICLLQSAVRDTKALLCNQHEEDDPRKLDDDKKSTNIEVNPTIETYYSNKFNTPIDNFNIDDSTDRAAETVNEIVIDGGHYGTAIPFNIVRNPNEFNSIEHQNHNIKDDQYNVNSINKVENAKLDSTKHITTIYLAGYDDQIFEFMYDIQKHGIGHEVLIYFYLCTNQSFQNIGYFYTNKNILRECIVKYTHFFCVGHNNNDCSCLENLKTIDPKENGILQIEELKDVTEKNKNYNTDALDKEITESETKLNYPVKQSPGFYEFILPKEKDIKFRDIYVDILQSKLPKNFYSKVDAVQHGDFTNTLSKSNISSALPKLDKLNVNVTLMKKLNDNLNVTESLNVDGIIVPQPQQDHTDIILPNPALQTNQSYNKRLELIPVNIQLLDDINNSKQELQIISNEGNLESQIMNSQKKTTLSNVVTEINDETKVSENENVDYATHFHNIPEQTFTNNNNVHQVVDSDVIVRPVSGQTNRIIEMNPSFEYQNVMKDPLNTKLVDEYTLNNPTPSIGDSKKKPKIIDIEKEGTLQTDIINKHLTKENDNVITNDRYHYEDTIDNTIAEATQTSEALDTTQNSLITETDLAWNRTPDISSIDDISGANNYIKNSNIPTSSQNYLYNYNNYGNRLNMLPYNNNNLTYDSQHLYVNPYIYLQHVDANKQYQTYFNRIDPSNKIFEQLPYDFLRPITGAIYKRKGYNNIEKPNILQNKIIHSHNHLKNLVTPNIVKPLLSNNNNIVSYLKLGNEKPNIDIFQLSEDNLHNKDYFLNPHGIVTSQLNKQSLTNVCSKKYDQKLNVINNKPKTAISNFPYTAESFYGYQSNLNTNAYYMQDPCTYKNIFTFEGNEEPFKQRVCAPVSPFYDTGESSMVKDNGTNIDQHIKTGLVSTNDLYETVNIAPKPHMNELVATQYYHKIYPSMLQQNEDKISNLHSVHPIIDSIPTNLSPYYQKKDNSFPTFMSPANADCTSSPPFLNKPMTTLLPSHFMSNFEQKPYSSEAQFASRPNVMSYPLPLKKTGLEQIRNYVSESESINPNLIPLSTSATMPLRPLYQSVKKVPYSKATQQNIITNTNENPPNTFSSMPKFSVLSPSIKTEDSRPSIETMNPLNVQISSILKPHISIEPTEFSHFYQGEYFAQSRPCESPLGFKLDTDHINPNIVPAQIFGKYLPSNKILQNLSSEFSSSTNDKMFSAYPITDLKPIVYSPNYLISTRLTNDNIKPWLPFSHYESLSPAIISTTAVGSKLHFPENANSLLMSDNKKYSSHEPIVSSYFNKHEPDFITSYLNSAQMSQYKERSYQLGNNVNNNIASLFTTPIFKSDINSKEIPLKYEESYKSPSATFTELHKFPNQPTYNKPKYFYQPADIHSYAKTELPEISSSLSKSGLQIQPISSTNIPNYYTKQFKSTEVKPSILFRYPLPCFPINPTTYSQNEIISTPINPNMVNYPIETSNLPKSTFPTSTISSIFSKYNKNEFIEKPLTQMTGNLAVLPSTPINLETPIPCFNLQKKQIVTETTNMPVGSPSFNYQTYSPVSGKDCIDEFKHKFPNLQENHETISPLPIPKTLNSYSTAGVTKSFLDGNHKLVTASLPFNPIKTDSVPQKCTVQATPILSPSSVKVPYPIRVSYSSDDPTSLPLTTYCSPFDLTKLKTQTLSIPHVTDNVCKKTSTSEPLTYIPALNVKSSTYLPFRNDICFTEKETDPNLHLNTHTNYNFKSSTPLKYNVEPIIEINLVNKAINRPCSKTQENAKFGNIELPNVNFINEINKFIKQSNILPNVLNGNVKTIPLNNVGMFQYESTNLGKVKYLKTDNPDIYLKVWPTAVKVVKAKIVFETEKLCALNFCPVVNFKKAQYTNQEIQNQVEEFVKKFYGDPIIVNNINYKSPYTVVDNISDYVKNGTVYIVWANVCHCGCDRIGCQCNKNAVT